MTVNDHGDLSKGGGWVVGGTPPPLNQLGPNLEGQ